MKGVYHFNPLDARQVGKLCHEHGVTILLATPTFLRSYLRRCERRRLSQTTDVVVTGAERLPPDVADAFEAEVSESAPSKDTAAPKPLPWPPSTCPPAAARTIHESTPRKERSAVPSRRVGQNRPSGHRRGSVASANLACCGSKAPTS